MPDAVELLRRVPERIVSGSIGQLQQLIGDFNDIGLAEFRRLLGEMAETPQAETDRFLVKQLVDFNGNRTMRAAIASLLATREDEGMIESFALVIEKETEVGLCKECILALEKIGSPEALQKLQYLARSKPNPTIAGILRAELEKLNQSEPLQFYVEQLKLGNQNPRASRHAARVLTRIAAPEIADQLMAQFDQLDEMAQVEAMRVIHQFGQVHHLPRIHALIEEQIVGLRARENLLDVLAIDQEEDRSTRVNRFLTQAQNLVPDSRQDLFASFRQLVMEDPPQAEKTLEKLKDGDYTAGLDFFLESVYYIQRNQLAHARKIHELTTRLTSARLTRHVQFLSEAAIAMGHISASLDQQEDLRLRSVEIALKLLHISRGDVIKSCLQGLGQFLRPHDSQLLTRLQRINQVDGMSRLLDRLARLRDRGFLEFFLNLAQNHEFVEVQEKALRALCAIEGIEPLIEEMLESQDPARLQLGIRLVGETANLAFLPRLKALLDHRSNIVRAETVLALGKIGQEACLDLILAAMKEAKSTALIHQCLEAMAKIQAARALEVLKEFVQSSRNPESTLFAVKLLLGHFPHWRNPLPDELVDLVLPLLREWLLHKDAPFRNEAYELAGQIYSWRIEVYSQLRDHFKEGISALRKQVNWNREEMARAESGLKKLNALYFQVKDYQEFQKTLKFRVQQPIQPGSQARTAAYERLLSHLASQEFPLDPQSDHLLGNFIAQELENPDLAWRDEDMLYRLAWHGSLPALVEKLKTRLGRVPAQARASLLEALLKNGVGLEQLSAPQQIRSVLVVEGSAFFANRIKSTLEKEGFAVRTSNDPQQALELTREFAPDLVLSEIQIKESGDGLDMLNAGLSQAARPFHIIISTNNRDPALMARIKALQPKAVLFKPYRCEELLQHLC